MKIKPGVIVKPLQDRILVRRVAAETVSKGGIFLPDKARDVPQEGIIMEVGEGRTVVTAMGKVFRLPLKFAVGDRVLFGKYVGAEIEIEGEEYPGLLLREDEILAKIEVGS